MWYFNVPIFSKYYLEWNHFFTAELIFDCQTCLTCETMNRIFYEENKYTSYSVKKQNWLKSDFSFKTI